jgi:hypothetical protein
MKRIITMLALLSGMAHAEQLQQKNITKLESYIRTADVAHFKIAYEKADNKQDIETQLLELAQNTKKELADELELASDGAINKKKLAMGALQALGIAYCAENAINLLYMAIKNTTLTYVWNVLRDIALSANKRPKLITYLTCRFPGVAACVAFWQTAPSPLCEYAYQPLALIPCALFSFLAYKAFKASAKNIKQGWNYKAHLETQIKNLDEIIDFLQADTITITTNPTGELI